jgi:hypothetical protein
MPRARSNFFEQHFEKLVLGISALVLIGAAAMFLVTSPFKTADGKGPGEICDEAARAAEQARLAVLKKQLPPAAAQKIDTDIAKMIDDGLIGLAKIQPSFGPVVKWSPTLVDMTGGGPSEDQHDLAKLLPPEKPVVRAGRATFSIPGARPLESLDSPGGPEPRVMTRAWAAVVAQLDLLEQGHVFRAAGYPPGKFDAPLAIVAVQLQRRVAGDPNAPWEDVETYRPFQPISVPEIRISESGRLSAEQGEMLKKLRELLGSYGDMIARTPPPSATAGGPAEYPPVPWIEGDPNFEAESAKAPAGMGSGEVKRPGTPGGGAARMEPTPERRFNKWMRAADAAMKGTRDRPADLDLAAILLEAAMGEEGVPPAMHEKAVARAKELEARRKKKLRDKPRRPEKMMPIAAIDLDATAGQSYVYRIRYEVVNPFYGEAIALKNPADARLATLMSDWSPPSEPVEIRTDTYYFVRSVNLKNRTADVDVFKLRGGKFVQGKFTVNVGDPIGKKQRVAKLGDVDFGTGAMLVDIVDAKTADNAVLVCVDTADGRLSIRDPVLDKRNPKYQQLTGNGKSR